MDNQFSRNAPFISEDTQKKLAQLKVTLIGCGLGSQVAFSLARVGVVNFKIWDFDTVDASNLNRQAFFHEHLGINKAKVTGEMLLKINPDISVIVNENRLLSSELEHALKDTDIAINFADFDDPLQYDIAQFMQQRNKFCLFPMNLGFGGMILVIGPGSSALEEITNGRQSCAFDFLTNLLATCHHSIKLSENTLNIGHNLLLQGDNQGWFPQNMIATLITSSLATYSVVKIAECKGASIVAPNVLHFEPF